MVEKRVLPRLPERDRELGEIRWGRWEPQFVVSPIDGSCPTCSFGGPLSAAFGSTWYLPPRERELVKRSRVAKGRRAVFRSVQPPPYWCKSHYAVRCPACDETCVYRLASFNSSGKFEELEHFYQAPTTERMVPPTQDDVLF